MERQLYKKSLKEAKDLNEIERWKISFTENMNCKQDITQHFLGAYESNTMDIFLQGLLLRHTKERILYVLGKSLLDKNETSQTAKEWLDDMDFCDKDYKQDVCPLPSTVLEGLLQMTLCVQNTNNHRRDIA